jgi:hypothetical protein
MDRKRARKRNPSSDPAPSAPACARALAAILALVAVAITVYVVVAGYVCGGMRVSEPCSSPAECATKSECVSAPHPFAPPFVALALVGLGGALASRRDVTLAGAVFAGGLATVLGFSIGGLEILAAAVLVAAGFALRPRDRRDRWLAWAALAALLAAVPLFAFVGALGVRFLPLPLVWLVFFAPALAWAGLAVVTTRRA